MIRGATRAQPGRPGVISYPDYRDWRDASRSFEDDRGAAHGRRHPHRGRGPERIEGARVDRQLLPGPARGAGARPAVRGRSRPARRRAQSPFWATACGGASAPTPASWAGASRSADSLTPSSASCPRASVRRARSSAPRSSPHWRWTADALEQRGKPVARCDRPSPPRRERGKAPRPSCAQVALRLEKEHPDHNTGVGAMVESLHADTVGELRRPLLVLLGRGGVPPAHRLRQRGQPRPAAGAGAAAGGGDPGGAGAKRSRLVRELLTESLLLGLWAARPDSRWPTGASTRWCRSRPRARRAFRTSHSTAGCWGSPWRSRSSPEWPSASCRPSRPRAPTSRRPCTSPAGARPSRDIRRAPPRRRGDRPLPGADGGRRPAARELPSPAAGRSRLRPPERPDSRRVAAGHAVPTAGPARQLLRRAARARAHPARGDLGGGHHAAAARRRRHRDAVHRGRPARAGAGPEATRGVPRRDGRLFRDDAHRAPEGPHVRRRRPPGATAVAVVNETLAAQVFPGQDPLGQRLRIGIGTDKSDPRTFEIVGVVGDVRRLGRASSPRPRSTCRTRSRAGPG